MGVVWGLAPAQVTPTHIVAEIDEFKGAWKALGALAPERLTALRRVATIESIGSFTRIEGSKLSDAEVERLLAFSDKDERRRGAYKTLANHVSAFDADGRELGVIFETATPFDTPGRMTELVGWARGGLVEKTLHPLLVTAIFTVVFLAIHPFQDGNGRLSRILTMLLLLRSGYAYVPYSSLESVIESNKDGYYLALRQTQRTIRTPAPDWQPWLGWFLRALREQKRRLESKIERERILAGALPGVSLRILDVVVERGRATIGEIVQLTGANRNTVKKHLASLVDANHLARHGAGKGTWYRRT
jgi:Fic family protein